MNVASERNDVAKVDEETSQRAVLERDHFSSSIPFDPGGQSIGPASEVDQSVVLLARELNLALAIIVERINRNVFQPALCLALKLRIERAVKGQQELQFRIAF